MTVKKHVSKLLLEQTTEGMKGAAKRYDLLVDGKIDLRGSTVRFEHSGLDLREFLLEGCNLSGSQLVNCTGEGACFDRCTLRNVRIAAEKATKISFRNASFMGAHFNDASLGPRTMDLTGAVFRNARLTEVDFRLGRLEGADFSGAHLVDVYFRQALLAGCLFRGATLRAVSFEKTELRGVDFTGAVFDQMEHWGEPNWEGAIISDELRYSYGIVSNLGSRVALLIQTGELGPEATDALRALRDRYPSICATPESMLIKHELEDVIPPEIFPAVLKALKKSIVQ
jgi:uncharacterized protein YjbI with pentapeptide repeats